MVWRVLKILRLSILNFGRYRGKSRGVQEIASHVSRGLIFLRMVPHNKGLFHVRVPYIKLAIISRLLSQGSVFSAIICAFEQYSVRTRYATIISSMEEGQPLCGSGYPMPKSKHSADFILYFRGDGEFYLFLLLFYFIFPSAGRAMASGLRPPLAKSLTPRHQAI